MPTETTETISGQLLQALQKHWSKCLAAGLLDHSTEAHDAVNESLIAYFESLAQADPGDTIKILETLRGLFARLDGVVDRFGGCLLETDERELIVPHVLKAAEVVGLNLDDFPYRDPTMEYRNF